MSHPGSAFSPEKDSALAGLERELAKWSGKTPDEILKRSMLEPEVNFDSLRDVVANIIDIANVCSNFSYYNVPAKPINDLSNCFSYVGGPYDSIQSYSPVRIANQSGNPTGERNRINSEFNEGHRRFFESIGGPLALVLTFTQAGELTKADKEREGQLAALAEARSKAEDLLGEIQEFKKASQDATRELGISQHSIHFKNQADEHWRWSFAWLAAAAVAVAATTFFGWANYEHADQLLTDARNGRIKDLPNGLLLQIAVAKLIVFSLALSATVWCAKVYRSHRHNYVVNRHRQNALSSFQTFVTSAGDDAQTKNAVLIQATQSIFAQQPTGYVSAEGETAGPTQLIEMVKTVSQSTK